ncbi:MAG TPA: methyl-accepting chemotaxis protein [Pseudomonas sp.]|nr:methyl-accepting chemotaxis protein [Pseudomonas sp.]
MKSVLYPAIALMNRLSFGMKFSLISVLFFVPMGVTNFYLLKQAYEEFQVTRIELQGLDLLSQSFKLRQDVQSYYDLVQINAIIISSTGGRSSELDSQIAALEASIGQALQALSPASNDDEAIQIFVAKRDEMLSMLKAAKAEAVPLGKVEFVEKLQSSSLLFSKLISTQSYLAQDADVELRQLTELIIAYTPRVAALLSDARATSAAAMGQKMLDSGMAGKLDMLMGDMEKMHAEYGLALDEAVQRVPKLAEVLGSSANDSLAALKSIPELVDGQVIMAAELVAPWKDIYALIGEGVEKSYRLDAAVMDLLQSELSERLISKRNQMILLLVALSAVFLIIVYLYGAFYVSTRSSLKGLGTIMHKVAGGDMTVRFDAKSQDELGELGEVFNGSVAQIRQLIERVGQTVVEVDSRAMQVEQVSAQSNQAVAGQRSQIELVATAMNEMSATAQEVARSAAAAVGSAQSVNDETVSGRTLVESQVGSIRQLAAEIDQSVAVINQLAGDSAAISQVLEVIKGIAEQTNLLALNAAIEAARAGEQGRGFAVVADEVRNLAKRTQQSTEEIEQMISRLQGGVGAAVKAMSASHHMADVTVSQSGHVQQALENILAAVGMIVDQNQQIATAAEEQTAVAQDIDQNIVEINQAGELTAEGADRTAEASRELSGLVSQLKVLISAFRV